MVLLNPGESVVRQANVVRQNPQGNRAGLLTLTNRRLVFEAQIPQGPGGGPVVRTTIDAPLFRLRNATTAKPMLGRARLEVELPQQVGVFEVDDADAWVAAITQARAAAPPPPPGAMGPMGRGPGPMGRGPGPMGRGPGPMGRGPGPMGRGPPAAPAVMLRCRYCGLLNQPTESKCTGCGAPI
jgi:hypothetical protein